MKKILVVEDDEFSRDALTVMLETLGYEVLAFSNGPEALENLGDTEIDLAMLDIMMPRMNGYELMEKLKSIDRYAQTPVIMVTAKDQDSEVLEGYSSGADYYITKPFTSSQIEYGLKLFLNEDKDAAAHSEGDES